jgi:hypothetical protein
LTTTGVPNTCPMVVGRSSELRKAGFIIDLDGSLHSF